MYILKKFIPLWVKEPIAIFFKKVTKFPMGLVFTHMENSFINNIVCSCEKRKYIDKKFQKRNKAYLEKKYKKMIKELTTRYTIGEKPEVPMIWIFWWQGIENAPDIIVRCFKSVCLNAPNYHVQIIDEKNYLNFVDVDSHMVKKLNNKTISLTHFSDYYRMALLAIHGGFWLDASLFVNKTIDIDVFKEPLFTVRNPGKDHTNISNWEWTVGAIGGWKGNTLFSSASKLLSEYWKDHDILVDYFLFDYIIRLLCDYCPELYYDLSKIAPNNSSFYLLQDNANAPFVDVLYKEMQQGCTWLYKISWKGQYSEMTTDGQETLYARWLTDTTFTDGGK